jgi:predicted lipoprotein with Yx(FWY)xxD motif
MFARRSPQSAAPGEGRRFRPARARLLAPLLLIAAAGLSATGLALASSSSPVVRSAANETLHETLVVDSHGRTVYVLSPETTHHLLCRSRACFALWPPLTVRSRSVKLQAGPGVHGHLGLLRRSNGTLQVTLGGLPLYRYSGDSSAGEANGNGIRSFGGTWHVVRSSTTQAGAPAMPKPATPMTPAPETPAY